MRKIFNLELNFLLEVRGEMERSSPEIDESPFDCCVKEIIDDFSFKDLKNKNTR